MGSRIWSRLRSYVSSRGGFTAGPVVVVVIIIGGCIIVAVVAVDYFARPGGRPHSLHLAPAGVVLAENVPQTIDVVMVLNHPLPTPTAALTWSVEIDEDDVNFDDDILDNVTVTFRSGDAYARGSFQVVCKNLGPTGDFDLEGVPVVDVSSGEAVQYLHAEGPGDDSANIQVTCTG